MATKFYKWKGKIEWAKGLFEIDSTYGDPHYKVTFEPADTATKNDIKASGVGVQYDKKEGRTLRFRREVSKTWKNGTVTDFGRPKVVNADNSDYTGDSRSIGNGTLAEITVAVYDAGRFKGHRLEEVKILDLIEYKPEAPAGVTESAKTEPSVAKKPTLPF